MAEAARVVGSSKQLFLDELWFGQRQGVELVVNRPRQTGERCLVADRPWESHRICAYNSVIEDGGLKMWYDAIANDGSRWLCYATSQDGVHWEKPALGLVPFGERRDTNIVHPAQPSQYEPSCVFIDANPKCPPEQRYKLAYYLYSPQEEGIYVAASGDGLRWQQLGRAFRGSDTANICFFDTRLGRYVAYVRVWQPLRKVGRCETDELTDWGQEQVVFSYDDQDEQGLDRELFSGMDFYTSAALKYPGAEEAYFLFPTAYYHYHPEVAERLGRERGRPWGGWGNDGPMDIQFATSRDGINWRRLDREPFIRLGLTGSWEGGYAYMASGCVLRQDEVWLYYAVDECTHGNYEVARDKNGGTITRAVLRRDGFVSADAGYGGGEFTTPPLQFAGRELHLNVDTSAGGHVVVEVQDQAGRAIAGLGAAQCMPINGNYIDTAVAWQEGGRLAGLAGQPVRLRFLMRDARLYAFQFR